MFRRFNSLTRKNTAELPDIRSGGFVVSLPLCYDCRIIY
nr:MAG TPA: hypothetical protein [Caudoviricetes sp.]